MSGSKFPSPVSVVESYYPYGFLNSGTKFHGVYLLVPLFTQYHTLFTS